ncbi:MAG: ORF6N domain-containing protein [Elusimicrobia bacterium]|nr:ORF6N domain-containing protein [Elusimicrobiota bacterium]
MKIAKIDALIHLIRGQRVMLDRDLAELYGVETKVLNQAVRRHANRFPPDFMFTLSPQEAERLRSQFVTSKIGRGGQRYHSNVFTEQGVAMLSSVLHSERAVEINIAIMRAFVKLRQALMVDAGLATRMERAEEALEGLESEQGEHAVAIHEVLAAMRKLTQREK